ncbi:23S rRNA (pseudouridine(1915)-N(3))-methyltransferase RlmH, partial [Vibrio sp. Vb2424]|uniref:23S rRNA (pseudouridine(1915)-N(3))-methyltransferase RlmH n=1 Tax=Vibrio sp. Vb2424 TaxID=2816074 RepID=UPI001A8E6D45
LEILNPNSFVIALDTAGTQVTSVKLSEMIGDWQSRSIRELCFIIGGADGISAEVRNRADYMLSLSFLTFTHEMARVILLEQIYRGYS